jgi:hypothetical protein
MYEAGPPVSILLRINWSSADQLAARLRRGRCAATFRADL